ncbi:Acetylpolyamine aminohydrolase [Mycobacteroides abscessus subsp. abscessus]|nr:Acetylpolyamine aminohydrolase [Mycobacteroides abscessus subsp. abscessus]
MDTFEGDPISGFSLCSDDYLRVGEDIAYAHLPTVFVLEGGYAVDAIGVNVSNVLEGYVACQS